MSNRLNSSSTSFTLSIPRIYLAIVLSAGLVFISPPSHAENSNLQSVFKFQTKMAAQGSAEAMIKLGEMCEEGLGTEKSDKNAEQWYLKARDKGHPEAQLHLNKLMQKREREARAQVAREQPARKAAAREQASQELAAGEGNAAPVPGTETGAMPQ